MKQRKPYQVLGFYDSETSTVMDSGSVTSFPILHQLGILRGGVTVSDITPANVETKIDMHLFRHTLDLYAFLDDLLEQSFDFVPVICCHNLAFDMYGLAPWLNRHDVRVLAKSARKPITFTIRDDSGKPALVIWDTLIFSQQGLERMGNDAGYAKAVGEWDYDLVRTSETPLTVNELDYAKRDIYTLAVWLGWWLSRNDDIEPERLALNVVTKTGVVRERRRNRFDGLKGKGLKNNVGRYFHFRCRTEAPKTDDELYTMQAATRGGFTFCASENASRVFDLSGGSGLVAGFDATSQHPAQMVSHYYPVRFKEKTPDILLLGFNLIGKYTLEHVLENWAKPFSVAFYACFEFENIRPKQGSLFEQCGILPLASARYRASDDDNGDRSSHEDNLQMRGYADCGSNVETAFGKVVRADRLTVYITELTAWEIWQCYDWDNVRAIHGYQTGRFTRPSDMDTISVMQFYEAKDEFKHAREHYYKHGTITNGDKLKELGIAEYVVNCMELGTLSDSDVEAVYLSLKADLNALFGISASNEYRRSTVLTSSGIAYEGNFGICNKPKNPKVWYQFGQRIVGWSRIAQICAMSLVWPYVRTIVNGDTDSFKVVVENERMLDCVKQSQKRFARAIDKGKRDVCARVKREYPDKFNPLDGIGHYVCEFVTDRFCASWNKAYCTHEVDKRDGKRRFHFTLAGVPTRRRISANACFIGIDGLADRYYELGYTFEQVCNIFLGYNVTFANDVIRLNGRAFPEWGDLAYERITDYLGNTCQVSEPRALALYPMSKTINDTNSNDNLTNLGYAIKNNAGVNTEPLLVYAGGVLEL